MSTLIDDSIVASRSREHCLLDKGSVTSDLRFVLNVGKSHLTPQQTGKWLGFIVDLMEGKFHVPGDKLESLYAVYSNASDSGYGGYMVDDTFTID